MASLILPLPSYLFSVNPSNEGTSSSHLHGSGSSTQQEGFGLDADFVAKVASIVTSQLSKLSNVQESSKLKPLQNQTLSEVVVQPADTLPPVKFDTQVFQNDLNSSFDHKALLHTIP